MSRWPADEADLAREQRRLAALAPLPWTPDLRASSPALRLGGCAVVFGRGGRDTLAWAGAVVMHRGKIVSAATLVARVDAPFHAGALALREGPILEAVVDALPIRPDVLLVAAAGRDHPHGAGLALHLGAVLDLPTVGFTDAPLVGIGALPGPEWMAKAPLRVGDAVVGYRVRTRRGAKPVVAHAAWRTSPEVAAVIAIEANGPPRWPESLREARRLARERRAAHPSAADA